MIIGDIIRVENANTYLVKIPPDARKERIGRMVKIEKTDETIVGVIKDITHTIREELIPYIEADKQPKYAPFNEDFRNSYYVVYGLGTIRSGTVRYDIDCPPDIRDKLELLTPDEMREFHTRNGKPCAAYFHVCGDALDKNLLLCIAEQVESGCPECIPMMRLVKKYIGRD
ncbi:MAG TPA: hypothetical protein VIO11_06870 [Candidatus Methanoperedens sp.]